MARSGSKPTTDDDRPRIGVSSCLLGEQVRFDGGHKRNDFLLGSFARFVEWVTVCPEVELGLGTPRETLRLERREGRLHLVMPKSGRDQTGAMRAFAARRAGELAGEGLSGYVLKKDSPSCGMERVKVHDGSGAPGKTGRGLFAEALMERLPLLPVEEEGRLADPRLRENFIERVFGYRRLQSLLAGRFGLGALVAFHSAHKLQLLSHSPERYRALGRLVAGARAVGRARLRAEYERGFMEALAVPATPRRHVNVLQHMLGYFSDQLAADERAELLEVVEDYRQGLVPLVVPLVLVRHHVRRFAMAYLAGQTYLQPHPRELMLRNHV